MSIISLVSTRKLVSQFTEGMVDRITEMFYEESIDHVYAYGEPEDASWQRSLDQSEDAAATVVHI